jgi:F-type H+-transporting ATPase subunit b
LKIQFRPILTRLALAISLLSGIAVLAPAQEAPAAKQSAAPQSSAAEKPDASDEFRHAPVVHSIAGALHLSVETTAQMLEDINSAILIGVILYFLLKVLPKAFRNRTETIQKELAEARLSTAIADERLSAVEAKLATLGEDIDQIRRQTENDLIEDEKRIKQSLEEERVRIVKSAEQEIDSASAAAQRDLKRFAANLAIDKAAQRIQLTAESDRAIVERFGKDLVGQFGKGERN